MGIKRFNRPSLLAGFFYFPMEETLIQFGGEVKSLGSNRIGGHLVVFGDATTPDLVGDYFTPETDFDLYEGKQIITLYDHGLDPTWKRRRLGRGTLRPDQKGLWLEAQLTAAEEYEAELSDMLALIETGKAGLSSGTASHLVERKSVGGAYEITSWPIVEASITVRPCEPRTRGTVCTLKSYQQSFESSVSEDLDSQTSAAVSALKEVTNRFRANHEARTKSGRVLSDKNRTRLASLMEQMSSVSADLQKLLEETEPMASDTEKRAALSNFLRLRRRVTQLGVQING